MLGFLGFENVLLKRLYLIIKLMPFNNHVDQLLVFLLIYGAACFSDHCGQRSIMHLRPLYLTLIRQKSQILTASNRLYRSYELLLKIFAVVRFHILINNKLALPKLLVDCPVKFFYHFLSYW